MAQLLMPKAKWQYLCQSCRQSRRRLSGRLRRHSNSLRARHGYRSRARSASSHESVFNWCPFCSYCFAFVSIFIGSMSARRIIRRATQGVYHSEDLCSGQICLWFVQFWPSTGQHAPCSRSLTARRCSSRPDDSDRRMQAQRAAERGADADVAFAERQLAAAQQELQAALQEQSALASVSNQVCMCATYSGLHIVPSCCAQHWDCRLESACSKSCWPEVLALMCAVAVQDVERIESAKAGAVAAVGGLLGSLPYLATAGHGVASTAVSAGQIFASCLLFGVTFRYVLAAGKDNVQLKGGVVAAFGLVRAAGQQACHI